MRFVLAVLIGLLLPAAALAGDAADIHARLASRVKDPELRDLTERLLREMNTDYSGLADKGLLMKGEKFEHARLEITGTMSNDNTNAIAPKIFDRFVKPSFSNRDNEKRGFVDDVIENIRDLANPARALALDIKDYRQASAGVMTERAAKVLEKYRDKEINEIVAHSWGCELIYAAILNGQMNPPKKLIVVGVPDDDFAKWEELARRTGTAVVWVRAKNDKVAQAGAKLAKDDGRFVDFKAKWDATCAISEPRTICDRRPSSVAVQIVIDDIPGLAGHGRKEYYDVLKDRKFIRGTFLDLRATEWEVKAAEIKLVEEAAFDAALRTARGLIAQARAQAKIAQRDHDERLKRAYVDMANRSCAIPGSVTQAELNALTDPYDREFVETPPRGLGACAYMAYMSLGRGADAEQLRRNSVQAAPVAAQPEPPPFNPNLPADPQPARTVPGLKFSSQFPLLKDLAVKACNSPAQVSIAPNQIRSSYVYSFDRGNDDRLAAKMSAEMDNCSRQVFNKLIEMIRSNRGSSVDDKWLRDSAARYQAPVYVEPPRSSPPTGCIPGDNSRRNCIACGNKYCP